MKIGIVIPWREQPTRVPAFNAVIAWYVKNLPEAKIILADHKSDVWLPSHTRNDGVRMAEAEGCDLIIMNDADTIPEYSSLMKTIEAAYEDDLIHIPYTSYRTLVGKGTSQHLVNVIPLDKCIFQAYDQACSGVNVFTPKAWWKIGGMDEKFQQWGYEDTAMQYAHKIINGTEYVRHPGTVYAFTHDIQNKTGHVFNNNKKLYDRYQSISNKDELLELISASHLQVKKMNILVYIHLYVPKHNAGSETMMHQVLLELKRRGHNIKVVCGSPEVTQHEGIDIYDVRQINQNEMFAWSDVVFTHLDLTEEACRLARLNNKPVVHFLHHGKQVQIHKITRASANLIVANSEWIKSTAARVGVPIITLYPPTNPKDYEVNNKSAKSVTLINLNENKGGNLFWSLARIMTDVSFIGVKGAYDKQIGFDGDLPNVTIYDNDPDIKKVYKDTKILLMPSALESWGRVGMEAAASGIPTIANPTPGLVESLGESGTFIDRNNLVEYVEKIRQLLSDSDAYEKLSKKAKERSVQVHDSFIPQMNTLEQELGNLV